MDKKKQNITSFKECLHKSKEIAIIGPLKLERYFSFKSRPTIFVDGGTKHKLSQKRLAKFPQISVGDHDSLNTNSRLDIEVSNEKNYSDLELALKLANRKNKILFMDGFFHLKENEKRFDHHYANLGACFRWCKNNNGQIYLNSKMYILPIGKYTLNIEGSFSLITLEAGKICLKGNCQYQLKNLTKIRPFSAQTISNFGYGSIELKTNIPILIIKY